MRSTHARSRLPPERLAPSPFGAKDGAASRHPPAAPTRTADCCLWARPSRDPPRREEQPPPRPLLCLMSDSRRVRAKEGKTKRSKKTIRKRVGQHTYQGDQGLAPSRQRSSEPSRASLRPGIIPRRISARTKVSDERARRHRTGREVQHGHRRRCPVPASRLSPRRARGGRAIISPPFLPFSVLLVQRA